MTYQPGLCGLHDSSASPAETDCEDTIIAQVYGTETVRQELDIPINFDVVFTRDSLNPANQALAGVMAGSHIRRVAVFIDGGVASAFPGISKRISSYLAAHDLQCVSRPVVYPGGEVVKNGWHYVMDMVNRLVRHRLCRHSFCIAVGGGALLDAAGFAGSMVHRGIRLIRMPTTVLSQDDSGVGVKNGINYNDSKNMIGAFAPPFAVINDFDFLRTLDVPVIRDGIAEAFKVAIIKDADFFSYLAGNARGIRECDWEVVETAVKRSALLHLHHIRSGGDPIEHGEARPLDFGHWSAHKLEQMSEHAISHGSAVAMGVALDTVIAGLLGYITADERDSILEALESSGMPMFTSMFEVRDDSGRLAILQGLEEFREHLGGRLCLTLPKGIGNRTEIHHLEEDTVEEAVKILG